MTRSKKKKSSAGDWGGGGGGGGGAKAGGSWGSGGTASGSAASAPRVWKQVIPVHQGKIYPAGGSASLQAKPKLKPKLTPKGNSAWKSGGGGGGGGGGAAWSKKASASWASGSKWKSAKKAKQPPELLPLVLKNNVQQAATAVRDYYQNGEVNQLAHGMLLNSLIAMPQLASPDDGASMVEAVTDAAAWPSTNACNYFFEKARQAMFEFLGEAEDTINKIRTRDVNWLVESGNCVLGVQFSAGKKPGSLLCEGGRYKIDEDRRGLETGDTVGVSAIPPEVVRQYLSPNDAGTRPDSPPREPIKGAGWPEDSPPPIIECEVVVARPLVIKPINSADTTSLMKESRSGKVQFRVDKLANRVQFGRALAAIHLASAPPGAAGKKGKALPKEHRPSDKVLNVLLAREPGEAHVDAQVKGGFDPTKEVLSGMNESQKAALRAASHGCVTLVQGPPGTGKTTCAVRILRSWANTSKGWNKNRKDGILATSDSNIAVDNIVEGLHRENVKVVRMGRPESARAELLEHCVDEIARKRLGYESVRDIPKEGKGREEYGNEIVKVTREADVVCCTAVGAGSGLLERHHFSRVLIDEASQATELATIIPFCRGCEQAVLCGDHCQLPPTVSSERAKEAGAELSLFERLVRDAGVKPHLLEIQYRMHPMISAFPRLNFYAGRLQDGIDGSARPAPSGFDWPDPANPVAFVPVYGPQAQKDGDSFYNDREAWAVVDTVAALIQGGLPPSGVGVVTPYGAQVRLIRRLLNRRGITTFRDQEGVEVASVDGYQGREKEAIVMSTVRNSKWGGIGFVADWRRANVAMTRAKRGLIIFGEPSTLSREESTWAPWLRWVESHGLSMTRLPPLPPPPLGGPPPVGLAAEQLGKWTGTGTGNHGVSTGATATSLDPSARVPLLKATPKSMAKYVPKPEDEEDEDDGEDDAASKDQYGEDAWDSTWDADLQGEPLQATKKTSLLRPVAKSSARQDGLRPSSFSAFPRTSAATAPGTAATGGKIMPVAAQTWGRPAEATSTATEEVPASASAPVSTQAAAPAPSLGRFPVPKARGFLQSSSSAATSSSVTAAAKSAEATRKHEERRSEREVLDSLWAVATGKAGPKIEEVDVSDHDSFDDEIDARPDVNMEDDHHGSAAHVRYEEPMPGPAAPEDDILASFAAESRGLAAKSSEDPLADFADEGNRQAAAAAAAAGYNEASATTASADDADDPLADFAREGNQRAAGGAWNNDSSRSSGSWRPQAGKGSKRGSVEPPSRQVEQRASARWPKEEADEERREGSNSNNNNYNSYGSYSSNSNKTSKMAPTSGARCGQGQQDSIGSRGSLYRSMPESKSSDFAGYPKESASEDPLADFYNEWQGTSTSTSSSSAPAVAQRRTATPSAAPSQAPLSKSRPPSRPTTFGTPGPSAAGAAPSPSAGAPSAYPREGPPGPSSSSSASSMPRGGVPGPSRSNRGGPYTR